MIDEKQMTLGLDWNGYTDVRGWFVSEKFDGCRAYWDGAQLWTRGGKIVKAPKAFTDRLPAGVHLDGEIWCGRDRFNEASKAVRLGGKYWTADVRFMVFDAPQFDGAWPWRMAEAARLVKHTGVAQTVAILDAVSDLPSLRKLLQDVKKRGGEGLMLRGDVDFYQRGRTDQLLKIKNWPR